MCKVRRFQNSICYPCAFRDSQVTCTQGVSRSIVFSRDTEQAEINVQENKTRCFLLKCVLCDEFVLTRQDAPLAVHLTQSYSCNTDVKRTRPLVFRRDPIARSVAQIPFGHWPLSLRCLCCCSGNWGQHRHRRLQDSEWHCRAHKLNSHRFLQPLAQIEALRGSAMRWSPDSPELSTVSANSSTAASVASQRRVPTRGVRASIASPLRTLRLNPSVSSH